MNGGYTARPSPRCNQGQRAALTVAYSRCLFYSTEQHLTCERELLTLRLVRLIGATPEEARAYAKAAVPLPVKP